MLKVVERIIEVIIRDVVNDMQFGFMPGRGTTPTIFILRQIQEKYIGKNHNLYFAFVDEKRPLTVSQKGPIVDFKESRHTRVDCACSSDNVSKCKKLNNSRINNSYSDVFNVPVGVHQGSVLSPLLFIIVLEALSREF